MRKVKVGDILIIDELWAAAAAHKLGFVFFLDPFNARAMDWRIKVTDTGANAAEKFMPMVGDLIQDTGKNYGVIVNILHEDGGVFCQFEKRSICFECDKIIERPHNGEMVPFPAYKIEV